MTTKQLTLSWKNLECLSFVSSYGEFHDLLLVNNKNRKNLDKYKKEHCDFINKHQYYFRGEGDIEPAQVTFIDKKNPIFHKDAYKDKKYIEYLDLHYSANHFSIYELSGIQYKVNGIHVYLNGDALKDLFLDLNIHSIDTLVRNLFQTEITYDLP